MRLGDDPMWTIEESAEGMSRKGFAFAQYDIEWLENAKDLSEISSYTYVPQILEV